MVSQMYHWPIEMFLAVDILAPTGGSSVPVVGRLDWNRCPGNCIKSFQDDLSSRLGKIAVLTDAICCSSPSLECDHSDTLLDYCDRIVDALKRAARRCIPRKPPPGCRKPGWSKALSQAQKEASAAYQKWKKLGKPRSGEAFQQMRVKRPEFRSSRPSGCSAFTGAASGEPLTGFLAGYV